MAATFPGGIKNFTTKNPGDPIESSHINEAQDEIIAIENELLKTSGSVVDHGGLAGLDDDDHPQYVNRSKAQTVDGIKTFSAIPVLPSSNPTSADQAARKGYVDTKVSLTGNETISGTKTFGTLPVLPTTTPGTNNPTRKGYADATYLTIAALLNKTYPVGAIYISTVSTNPGTIFGGTWEAFGQGQVLVGKAPSGTFATAGSTGGAETHNHSLANAFAKLAPSTDGWFGVARKYVTSWAMTHKLSGTTSTTSDSASSAAELGGNTDSGSSLQPYIVVYMWKRTA